MDLDEKIAAQLMEQGAALWEIRDTAGFKLLKRSLDARAAQAAIAGMEDTGEDAKPIDYWRGYVAACKDVVANVDTIIEHANELKENAKADGREAIGIRIGRGGGGLATEEAE